MMVQSWKYEQDGDKTAYDHRCRNDFSVGEAKIGEKNQDNQIHQSITLSCNMYFSYSL